MAKWRKRQPENAMSKTQRPDPYRTDLTVFTRFGVVRPQRGGGVTVFGIPVCILAIVGARWSTADKLVKWRKMQPELAMSKTQRPQKKKRRCARGIVEIGSRNSAG